VLYSAEERNTPVTLCPERGAKLPRYFFNVNNGIKTQDLEGTELANLAAAKVEARKDIDEIAQTNFPSLNSDWSKSSIEICDQDGALLLVVPFSNN
jgi:Domain of unknown function (DUF6894)